MTCSFLCFCGKVSSDGGETKQRSVGFDTTISSGHTGIPLWLTKCYCATQLLLYQRGNHQFWEYSWLTKYYCTLYKHVTATVLLAQSSGGIPMWMTKYYCSGVQLLPLLLCYRHCHLFSACPVLTTVTVLWKENNLLLHHNPWYILYISISHSVLVLVGNCMVAFSPTISAQLSPCTDTTISLRRVQPVATGHCHRLSFPRISPSSPNQQLKQRVKMFLLHLPSFFLSNTTKLWPELLFLGWFG